MKAFIEFLRLAFVLFITCAVAAASLAVVNLVTKKPIEEYEKNSRIAAVKDVLPGATEIKDVEPGRLWDGFSGSRLVGRAIAISPQGYGGPINLIFGIDGQNTITGVKIVSQTETPGLGAKVAEPAFTDQFKGKTRDQLFLKKDNPAGGSIDAITGATISPRAVTAGVRTGLESFLKGGTDPGAAKEAR
jgi:electron transport complex protein RnfG